MNSLGLAACGPYKQVTHISSLSPPPSSRPCFSPIYAIRPTQSCRRLCSSASSYRRSMPVCLFGGKRNSGKDNEGSPWEVLEKAWGGLTKKKSMEDILKEQIQKREFADEGGGAGIPPGGGGGGDDGFSGSEDESSDDVLDEFIQVTLATIGLIFVYIYIIDGEELTRLVGDFIKYLFTGRQSNRLMQTMYMWRRFYRHLTKKREEVDKYWLEREIIRTPTWWYDPTALMYYLRSRLSPSSSHRSSPSYYE